MDKNCGYSNHLIVHKYGQPFKAEIHHNKLAQVASNQPCDNFQIFVCKFANMNACRFMKIATKKLGEI